MKPLEIKDNIYWVGAVDWGLRDFHGYSTEKGSSYNAYLVKDKKTVLFDTVKADLTDDLIDNIRAFSDPADIDYIVVNHAEMDHTGALPRMIEIAKPEKIFCTAKCEKALKAHFHFDSWPLEIVKEGDTVNIGERTITFYDSKMLHWPESMVSYIEQDKLLISNDIFGQHWATSERFDDEVDRGELFWQSAKYFANIFMPFTTPARKFVEKLRENNLEIDMIAPDHGLIWRSEIDAILDKYMFWSSEKSLEKVIIVFGTMWGSTAKMAEEIGKGVAAEDVSVQIHDLRKTHRSDVMTEALEARAIVLGSSIMNNNILPMVGDLLTYMKGLKPGKKLGASFGSYGWADRITKMLNEELEEMKFELIGDGISSNYVPSGDDLHDCYEFGREIGRAVKAQTES